MHLPSTPKHQRAAGFAAALMSLAAALLAPHAAQSGPVIAPFLPIFATWVTLTEGLTAFLLWIQYRVSGRLAFATLAGAYAFTSLIAALQLLVFPGVFSAGGLFGAGSQTAVWVWVFWHAGFPALVTASLIVRAHPPHARARRAGRIATSGGLLLAFALWAIATFAHRHLPTFVSGSGSYTTLSSSPAGLVVCAISLAAIGLHVSTTRLRSLLDLWLAVALLGMLVDVMLTLWAGARYSVGWYAARVASMVSSSAVLGMLIYETSVLYRTLTETHHKLVETAARDGLTGVFNRAYFDERYPRELELAASGGYPLCVLMVDVDHFKAYNDTFGHMAGDSCLKSIAGTLSSRLQRRTDFVARYGGEEFVIVLVGCDAGNASGIAQELRAGIESLGLPAAPGVQGVVTASIGHACALPGASHSASELLAAADAALYRAKALGRNHVASSPLPGRKDVAFHGRATQSSR